MDNEKMKEEMRNMKFYPVSEKQTMFIPQQQIFFPKTM